MASKKTTKNIQNVENFEQNLEKLESIVAKMEEGQCSLDDAFSMFEEGVGISKKCSAMLECYERKIYLIKEGKLKGGSDKGKKAAKGDNEDGSEHYLDIFTDDV